MVAVIAKRGLTTEAKGAIGQWLPTDREIISQIQSLSGTHLRNERLRQMAWELGFADSRFGPLVMREAETDPAAKHALVMFVSEHFEPTCQALDALQEETVRSVVPGKDMQRIASYGLRCEPMYAQLWEAKERMYECVHTRTLAALPMAKIIDGIQCIRADYDTFCHRTLRLTNSDKPSPSERPKWTERWNAWALRHNALVKAHDQLCDSGTVPQLYQPTNSREFRGTIDLVEPDVSTT